MTDETVFVHDHVLGTVLETRVTGTDAPEVVDEAVRAEIARLDGLLSTYRESELTRWARGGGEVTSLELLHVLAPAQEWHDASGGAFHPAVGGLRRRTRR